MGFVSLDEKLLGFFPRKKIHNMGILVFLLAIFALVGGISASDEVNGTEFITWDDMRVDVDMIGERVRTREDDNHSQVIVVDDQYGDNQSRVIIVDQNGRGDSLTVQGAVDMVPDFNSRRIKIFILPGIYREKVHVPKHKPYISFIGNESEAANTVITWHDKASDKDANGNTIGTYKSATVTVDSDCFCAYGITFENSVITNDSGKQAVALRIGGDKAVFYKIRALGRQDTLLDESGSHYFYQCYIEGTVDFIFGRARSRYQECVIHSVSKTGGAIAAHHRDEPDDSGFSFVNCTINGTGKILLGRAWGTHSRIVFSYCTIADIITPSGWSDWGDANRQKTAVFGEYHCWGKGADTSRRVRWAKKFSFFEARPYLRMAFIGANQWLRI